MQEAREELEDKDQDRIPRLGVNEDARGKSLLGQRMPAKCRSYNFYDSDGNRVFIKKESSSTEAKTSQWNSDRANTTCCRT